jgi:hypothetical protein
VVAVVVLLLPPVPAVLFPPAPVMLEVLVLVMPEVERLVIPIPVETVALLRQVVVVVAVVVAMVDIGVDVNVPAAEVLVYLDWAQAVLLEQPRRAQLALD